MLVGTDPDAAPANSNEPDWLTADPLRAGDAVSGGRTFAPWQLGLLVTGVVILALGVFLIVRASRPEAPAAQPAAATAPPPSVEPYQFEGIRWGTPINEVAAQLASHGFVFSEQDEEGDHVFSGSLDGHAALAIAMLSRGALVKMIVVMPAKGRTTAAFDESVQRLATTYGAPETPAAGAAGRPLATWAPHPDALGDTRLWVTVTDAGDIATHYESGQWPAESQRRKESHRAPNPASAPATAPVPAPVA